MVIFLGDLHLGRGSVEESRAAERDAVDLLRARADALARPDGRLVLVGDVFDAYIEYEGMVPSGFVRFQGALAELVDAGVRVDYVVGNRDHWHLTHFEDEIGVKVHARDFVFEAFGQRVMASHGDRFAPVGHISNRLSPILRSRIAFWLYRNIPPGDTGFRFARALARGGSGQPQSDTVSALRSAAERLIGGGQVDVVVMGHAHQEELARIQRGYYMNVGFWFEHRTYGRLLSGGPELATWPDEAVSTPSGQRAAAVNSATTV